MEQDWDEVPELWEHQGQPLTVGQLRSALGDLASHLLVRVLSVDASGQRVELDPMEIGPTGSGVEPGAIIITAVPLVGS